MSETPKIWVDGGSGTRGWQVGKLWQMKPVSGFWESIIAH
jgi:hypothetical protein